MTSPEGFTALGLSQPVADVLARQGITTPTPIQLLAIPDALSGRDVCGKARTGSGKTLAFGLPLLERITRSQPGRPKGLVLVPTRELAVQIATALTGAAAVRRLRIAAIYGGVSLNAQADRIRSGVDVLVATPGRLNDLLTRGAVSLADAEIVVIDEADQMADLGFLPQVERILDRIERVHQTLLFSATLDGAVDRLVRKYQDNPAFHEAETPVEASPAMQHRFVAVTPVEKVAVAAAIAAGPERTLFFVRTRRAADRLVVHLEREGVAAGRLHGRLSQPQRDRALRDFVSGDVRVLVATNIAARGIHVDGVDIVVHFDPPEDAKTYLHRSGRTARAGASGVVVTLAEPAEHHAVHALRREAGIREAVVAMGPSDRRLAALAAWSPPMEEPRAARAAPLAGRPAPARPRRPGGAQRGPAAAPRSQLPSAAPGPVERPEHGARRPATTATVREPRTGYREAARARHDGGRRHDARLRGE